MDRAQGTGFVEGQAYTRAEIGRLVGGDVQQRGLPWKGGRVTCAVLGKDRNVAPPDVILVGASRTRRKRGEALCAQGGDPIPVFVTEGRMPGGGKGLHVYRGLYAVVGWSEDPRTLPLWEAAAGGREDGVGLAIFLERRG